VSIEEYSILSALLPITFQNPTSIGIKSPLTLVVFKIWIKIIVLLYNGFIKTQRQTPSLFP
jgi:hypothetical protein